MDSVYSKRSHVNHQSMGSLARYAQITAIWLSKTFRGYSKVKRGFLEWTSVMWNRSDLLGDRRLFIAFTWYGIANLFSKGTSSVTSHIYLDFWHGGIQCPTISSSNHKVLTIFFRLCLQWQRIASECRNGYILIQEDCAGTEEAGHTRGIWNSSSQIRRNQQKFYTKTE